jgi:polymerase delta-interacting protein 2
MFLHKLFGYRGIVLIPWHARVFDRSETLTLNNSRTTESKSIESRTKTVTYYNVLIDYRDIPFTCTQSESVTFLGRQENNRSLFAIPGLDYASHDDLIPYTSTEKTPLVHELFEKFFMYDPESETKYMARESLKDWQDKNHPWLEMTDVCIQVTQNIRITAIPFYMGFRENQDKIVYWWRYLIRIENLGAERVILRDRHWRIFSMAGTLETVQGKGVIGQEPVLDSKNPAFQYSSHVSLESCNGHMWGTFRMEREDGSHFEAKIPAFNLESREEDMLKGK